ncbi:unnamed protein product, partial [Thlaspi arvense]
RERVESRRGSFKMRAPGESEDAVVIEKAKKAGEAHVITVNCPDRTGLGCDICRIILDFWLYIVKGDVTTDGVWCYIVLWVMVTFEEPACICMPTLLHLLPSQFDVSLTPCPASSPPVYLLKFFCLDRRGLLHGTYRLMGRNLFANVTQVLIELELSIQTVKVTTTPDERYSFSARDLLHTKKRQDETLEEFLSVLGESCISCELELAGPEFECHQNIPSLSPAVAQELFTQHTDEDSRAQVLTDDMIKLKNSTNVTLDNSLSPAHTLLQIRCVDHRGLLYDVLRTLKDFDIKISYDRFLPQTQGHRDLELFVQLKDEKKILDPDKQNSLSSRLKTEMLHPLRVIIANRGPDTELLVELSGKGRPRVFYGVTLSLKVLGICVFAVREQKLFTEMFQNQVRF